MEIPTSQETLSPLQIGVVGHPSCQALATGDQVRLGH